MFLSIPDCQLEEEARDQLSSLSNNFINSIEFNDDGGNLLLEFRFGGKMKPVVWETRNPFSLVLDITSVGTLSSTTPAVKSKPAQQKKPVQPKPKPAQLESRTEKKKEDDKPGDEQKRDVEESKKPVFVPAGVRKTSEEKKPVEFKPKGIQPQKASEEKTASPSPAPTRAVIEITPETHFYKGLTLHEDGKNQQALKHFQQARKDPHLFAESTAEIAAIYHQLGRTQEEIAEWEKLFSRLRASGYSPSDELLGGNIQDLDLSNNPGGSQSDQQGAAEASGAASGFLITVLCGIILLLTGGLVWLYLIVRKLQDKLGIKPAKLKISLKLKKSWKKVAAENEEEEQEEKEESSEEEEPQTKPEEPSAEEESTPWGEAEKPDDRPSEETATEVISLSEQGFSIQEIAEKLGLGQDEVRLILNLQREETETSEMKK